MEVKAQDTTSLASIKTVNEAAQQSRALLTQMEQAAADADTTLTGIYADAEQAKTSADSAWANLSQVQSVLEVAQWIATHGTYVKATTFNPNATYYTLTATQVATPSDDDKDSEGVLIYYELDNGIYVRTTDTSVQSGKTYYNVTGTPVSQPSAEHIADYYTLNVTDAMADYIKSHLALTDDGLYVMKDNSEWKVKIADDGVYILDPNDNPANQMTASGNIIGYDDETHAEIDYHSLKLIAKDETDPYLYISDLRSKHTSEDEYGEGFYYVADDQFDGDGTEKEFKLSLVASRTNYKVYLNSELVTSGITKYRDRAVFDTAPVGLIKVEYPSDSNNLKAYTLGHRDYNPSPGYYPKIGAMSVAEGIYIIASGWCTHAEGVQSSAIGEASHAEGYNTIARGTASHAEGGGPFSYKTEAKGTASHAEGWDVIAFADCSHAEGRSTEANGEASHAQNRGTIANRANQTTIGRYNDNKSDTALEIGNGTSSARSNSHDFTWDGNIRLALDTTATSGTDKEIYDALVSLGWDSDVIV